MIFALKLLRAPVLLKPEAIFFTLRYSGNRLMLTVKSLTQSHRKSVGSAGNQELLATTVVSGAWANSWA